MLVGFMMNVKVFCLFIGYQILFVVLFVEVCEVLLVVLKLKVVFYYCELFGELVDELWWCFVQVLLLLCYSGWLGLVYFQFLFWLVCNCVGYVYVVYCVECMEGFWFSIEFCNISWFDDVYVVEMLVFQCLLGMVYIIVDEFQGFINSVFVVWVSICDIYVLVCLYGCNVGIWNYSGVCLFGCFNYDYDDVELEGLVCQVLVQFDCLGLEVYVVFNNNVEDQVQCNGCMLMCLMDVLGVNVVRFVSVLVGDLFVLLV